LLLCGCSPGDAFVIDTLGGGAGAGATGVDAPERAMAMGSALTIFASGACGRPG
jgi:hypothetical protein